MRTSSAPTARPKPAVALIIVSLLAIWILWKISGPFVELRRTKLAAAPLQGEKQRLQRENLRLQKELQKIQSPEGMRIEAHKQGWLAPGERRLVFIAPETVEVKPAPPPRTKPAFTRAWTWSRNKARHIAKIIGY